jgi:two-component system, NtrC family, response regulator AlgB
VLSREGVIHKDDLPDALFQTESPKLEGSPEDYSLDKIEEAHIKRVLAQAPSLEAAAEMLGIGTATLWRKRKRYGLE